ncbi:MAG: baseplate J/gp47 family protein [Thermodesulfobacteriota bacterium]|nr:baseplate J/gp47 family protein [Thermodesulfobacteriota bacterium]
MSFQKDFDEIFNAILTDYQNQFPEADISQGSLIYIKSACMASALWGLYKYQDWIAKQIFPDTADTAQLEHHAWIRGLSRKTDETDAGLLARLLDYIKRPPAGGNQYDYVKWALEMDNVKAAYCLPLGQGPGTVDIIILANETITGSEIPSTHTSVSGTTTSVGENQLNDSAATFITDGVAPGDVVKNIDAETQTTVASVDSETKLTLASDIFDDTGINYEIVSLTTQTWEYIEDVRPVTASTIRVMAPAVIEQAVTMTVSGEDINTVIIKGDIESYVNGMLPGEDLALARLTAIAMGNDGVDDVSITVPAANVTATDYQIIRPGTVNVSET